MKQILWILFWTFMALPMNAQSEYISNSRYVEADRIEDLDGKSGLILLSMHNDLVINITNLSKKAIIRPNGKSVDGLYEYHVIISEGDTRNPKVEVSRRGNVYKTEFVSSVKPDYMIAYRIEEVANPIRMDDQTKPNDARLNAEEAELEFTTTIKNLKVVCSPKLAAQINSHVSTSDNNVTITSVIIPIAILKEAQANLEKLQVSYDDLDKWIRDNSDKITEKDWDKQDELKEQIENASSLLDELSTVDIYGDGTNHLSIDISDLGPRSKKSYAVLPLTIEKKIFVTECSAYMNQAGNLFSERKYEEARAAYTSALQAKDVVVNMKPAIAEAIVHCDSCARYEALSSAAIKKVAQMKQDGKATQEDVARYISVAIDYMRLAYTYNPCDFYTERIHTMEKLLAGIPLKIKFTIVEWLTFEEGNPISGVEIWAYYGERTLASALFSSERRFKKMVNGEPSQYKQLSISNGVGVAQIELDRKELPKGLLFCPIGTKNIKIKHVSMQELMQQSTGTYMEKQFRLKMYTKLK